MAALDLISVAHDVGQPGDQLNGLAQHVLHGEIVRILVIGIQGQHRPGQLVHDVGGGRLDDHVLGKILRQLPAAGQQLTEFFQLLPGGQLAEQQQPGGLLVAEPVFFHTARHQIAHVHAPVDQTAFLRRLFPFVHHIAMDVADQGQSGHDAAAVSVAKTALHVVLFKLCRFDPVIFFEFIA